MTIDEKIARLRKLNEVVMRDLDRLAETDQETADKLRAITKIAARDTEKLAEEVEEDF